MAGAPGAFHGPSYGLDADLKNKLTGKLDPKLEAEAKEYLQQWLGSPVNDLHKDLLSGVTLCQFLNKIGEKYTHAYGGPPCRNISNMNMPFKHMENIGNFLNGCEKLGLRKPDCFMTVDLYEWKNPVAVVDTILALKRKFPYKFTCEHYTENGARPLTYRLKLNQSRCRMTYNPRQLVCAPLGGAMQPAPGLGKRAHGSRDGSAPPAKRATSEPTSWQSDHQIILQVLERHTPENRVRLLVTALQRLGMGPSAAALFQAPIPPTATAANTTMTEGGEEQPAYSYFE